MRLRAAAIVVLSVIGAVTCPAQRVADIDSTLRSIQALYDVGSYLSAEVEARRYLEGRSVSDSARIVGEQLIAFSLVAQGKSNAAAGHFAIILALDSTYALDPILTSPKIRQAFEMAHQQSHYAEWVNKGRSPAENPPSVPAPTFRLLLFPGWDQFHQGKAVKGTVLLSAGLLTLGSSVTFAILRQSAREDYLAAASTPAAASEYTTYDWYSKATYYSIAAFLVVYVYSAFDAFLDLPPQVETAVNGSSAGLVLSLSWRL